jgi:cytochrome P450
MIKGHGRAYAALLVSALGWALAPVFIRYLSAHYDPYTQSFVRYVSAAVALVPLVGDSMFVNHGEIWSSRRAVMARQLHPSRMGDFHHLFVEGAEALAAGWQGRVDVAPGLGAATALAVMRALFGDGARMADAQRLVTSFTAFEGAVMGVDLAYLFGLPPRFSGFQFRSARRHARDVRRICSDAMAIAEPGGILGALRAAQKADGAALLDETQLISEVAMMLLAGSETSANALSWAL